MWISTHNLLNDFNPVLSTETTGSYRKSLTLLSYIELSFQAPSYDHILLIRAYALTKVQTLTVDKIKIKQCFSQI